MLHINEEEANRYLARLYRQQQSIREKAIQEEEQQIYKEEAVLAYMEPHAQLMDRVKDQLMNPSEFLPQSKFLQGNKFAVLVCSRTYDTSITTMRDLPAVTDDYKCAMSLVNMMGILPENVFVLQDTNYDTIKEFYTKLTLIIMAKTKELKSQTGIIGKLWFNKGLLWDRVKKNAMKPGASKDFVVVSFDKKFNIYLQIDLEQKEQNLLKEFVELQEKAGSNTASIGSINDSKEFCGVQWKDLRKVFMQGDKDTQRLKVSARKLSLNFTCR